MNKHIFKYYASLTALIVCGVFVLNFYMMAMTSASGMGGFMNPFGSMELYKQGIIIFVMVGVSALVFYYQKAIYKDWQKNNSTLGYELNAYNIMSKTKDKSITIKFVSNASEIERLVKNGEIMINKNRVSMPVRVGDCLDFFLEGEEKSKTTAVAVKADKTSEIIYLKSLNNDDKKL